MWVAALHSLSVYTGVGILCKSGKQVKVNMIAADALFRRDVIGSHGIDYVK